MSAADRRRMRLGFAVLFALVFLRVCRYGLSYLPMLDDYIQYYNYANLYPDRAELLRLMGAFSARPLAGVLDIVFWSRFWDHLIAAVALLSALYAAAGMLFFSVWRRRLGATWLFPVLFALFPWGLEGTYWLSASTRIVPGMFFTALALWCFDRWCEQGGKGALVGYFLAQLLSFGFYEQTLLLSCACLVLGFALWAGKALRRALAAAWTFVCGGAYLLVTTLAPAGNLYGARTALLLPWQEGCGRSAAKVARQMWEAFFPAAAAITGKGTVRGLGMLGGAGGIVWLALLAACCAGLFALVRRGEGEKRRFALELLFGVLLAAAPLSIYFVLQSSWFTLRAAVSSFCGLALVLDALFGGLLSRRREVLAGMCAAVALVFCIAAVSEVHDYRETALSDERVLTALREASDGGAELAKGNVLVIGLRPSYLPEQNYLYHDHIHGVTETDWALTGALRCVCDRVDIPVVTLMTREQAERADGLSDYRKIYLVSPDGTDAQCVIPGQIVKR